MGVIGAECSTVEPPPFFGRTEDELRACATAALDELIVELPDLTINGQDVDVGDLEAYRTSSPLFTLTFPENNFFGVEPGVAQSVSEGYGFIIAPPPPGEYEMGISVAVPGESEPFVSTITVVVEAPQVIEAPPSTAPGSTGPVESPPGANLERYCALVQALDAAGTDAFAELEADESATDEDYAEVERQFIEDHQDEFDELREVAPQEIADDVNVLLDALKERAAGGEQQE